MNPLEIYPPFVLALDYVLGAIMWTILARWLIDLFVARDSTMVMAKVFRQVTDPFLKLFRKVTPGFLHPSFHPLYAAWWFYMLRFYVIPFVFFGRFGMLSFPLEYFIADALGG